MESRKHERKVRNTDLKRLGIIDVSETEVEEVRKRVYREIVEKRLV